MTAAREWTPYGVELGAAQPGLGYTGEWWDTAVGLQYLRARWYDGRVGRFTQKDPIAGILSWGKSCNAYGYAEQNPVNYLDSSGLLSNRTIARSFGVDRFEDVLAIIERSGDWGYLRMLQDAEVGDKVYAGPFNWPSYLGTIECYDPSRHSPEPSTFWSPLEGGVVLADSPISAGGEETLFAQARRMGFYRSGTFLFPPPDWYLLNSIKGGVAYTTKTDMGYLPDYVVVSGGSDLIENSIVTPLQPGIGWNVAIAVDRYGYVYWGGGFDVGWGIPGLPFAGSIGMGWINQNPFTADSWIPGSGTVEGFVGGWGGGATISVFAGVSAAYNYDDSFPEFIAKEFVSGTPTYSWNFIGYMGRVPWLGQMPQLEWDWVDRYPIEHGYGRQDIRTVDDRPVDCGC